MPTCRQCNSPIAGGDTFCGTCGAPLPPPPAPAAGHGGRGFWGALFDLSFQDFVTPRIIRMLFVAGLVLYGLAYLVFVLTVNRYFGGGAVAVLFGAAIGFIVALVLLRVGLELAIVLLNVTADLRALRRLAEQPRQNQGG